LEQFAAGSEIGPEQLRQTGLVKKVRDGIKLLAQGDIAKALTVRVHEASLAAKSKIEAAGGRVELI
jgi:large subunit ribosomal protein L15